MTKQTTCLCFQDVMQTYHQDSSQDNDVDDGADESSSDVATVFFELANAPLVSYRIVDDEEGASEILIRQDIGACGQHTGGIVWETSYLLLNYLRSFLKNKSTTIPTTDPTGRNLTITTKYPCGKTLIEVGAGCGLLGLGVHRSKLSKRVILTETDEVLPNLRENVDANFIPYPTSGSKDKKKALSKKKGDSLRVCPLDWTRYKEECEAAGIEPHSIDMIVGTDVVFSTRFVDPLLETLRYLAHSSTTILLCLQERCKDSHDMLLANATKFGLTVTDVSAEITATPGCEWGKQLDCCILKLQVIDYPARDERETEKKRKRNKLT